MRSKSLILSHWDDPKSISVSEDVARELTPHQICGIRFLYSNFRREKGGAILNHEPEMNFKIQVSAFFNALSSNINSRCPVLVVCPLESLNAWHYHLTTHAKLDVKLLSTLDVGLPSWNARAILVTAFDDSKKLLLVKERDFFCIVVEELDKVVTKAAIRSLKGSFNIGLTTRNFLKCPDQKLFWNMLKWISIEKLRTFKDFRLEDDEHLANLRNPYESWWQRLTWKYCDTFKPKTDEEELEYQNILQKWNNQNTTYVNSQSSKLSITRKRKTKVNVAIKEQDSNSFKYTKISQPVLPSPVLPTVADSKEDNASSQDTIIYEIDVSTETESNYPFAIRSPSLIEISNSCSPPNCIQKEEESPHSSKLINDDALSLLFGSEDEIQKTVDVKDSNEEASSSVTSYRGGNKRQHLECDINSFKNREKSNDDVLSMLFG